jgi:CTP-dependent riboflavin kinase
MTATKVPKRIGRHDALVALGVRDAELQCIIDETGQLWPLLADKDCGLKRNDVSVLATAGYVRRSYNMLGDAVRIKHKGYAYLAAHRGDVRDADLVGQCEQLAKRILDLHEENRPLKRTDWISGQLGRATDAEIRLLEHELAELRAMRRRRAGGDL